MDNQKVENPHLFVVSVSEDICAKSGHKSSDLEASIRINVENAPASSSICRTCATNSDFVIPIFNGEGLQNNLAEKIHQHLPIQVSTEDTLPLVMCYQCASTLLAWHELLLVCKKADTTLREMAATVDLNKPSTSTQDTSHNHMVKNESESASRTCQYCAEERGPDHKKHLLTSHAEQFFHCAECDTYVDRNSLLIHMSVHAIQYAATGGNERGEAAADADKSDDRDASRNTERGQAIDDKIDEASSTTGNVTPSTDMTDVDNGERTASPDSTLDTGQVERDKENENEFSDHSDNDNGFEPLPESIFDAIEDSQDGQAQEVEEVANKEDDRSERPDDDAKKSNRYPRTCPVCRKVYKASSSYFYHMKYTHRGGEQYECDTCGRKFRTRANLQQHRNVHEERFEYECDECGKKYKNKVGLYIHIQGHATSKRFSCDRCPRAFRWKQQLLRHLKRHAAERAHVCTVCGRGFNVRCDMLRHARTHDAGSHACHQCGACFAQLRYLKVHMEKKHSVAVAGNDGN